MSLGGESGLPHGKGRAHPSSCGCAAQAVIAVPSQRQGFDGTRSHHPVEDFRRARIQCPTRQIAQSLMIATLQGSQNGLIEGFVDDEVAQSTRGHDRDPHILRTVAQGLT